MPAAALGKCVQLIDGVQRSWKLVNLGMPVSWVSQSWQCTVNWNYSSKIASENHLICMQVRKRSLLSHLVICHHTLVFWPPWILTSVTVEDKENSNRPHHFCIWQANDSWHPQAHCIPKRTARLIPTKLPSCQITMSFYWCNRGGIKRANSCTNQGNAA